MKKTYVDLRGVNTHNKGAQLMMMAVADRLGDSRALAVSPNGSDFLVRSKLGYRQTLILNQAPRLSAFMGNRVPTGVRELFGLAAQSDISGVLDAAGFAYSDAFGPQRSEREAKLARRWKRAGVPVILLPQAFGPFEKPEQARWSRELLESADLVFARDRQSFDHVAALSPAVNLKLSPDFTIGLKPRSSQSPVEGDFGAIVPNSKMVSHTGMSVQDYEKFLIDASRAIDRQGLRPVVVVHEFNDRGLAAVVARATGAEVFEHSDPLVLKSVLGRARVVVASRFHALVSSLSSSTPVVALGWSHKYTELLSDFGVEHWLTDGTDDVSARIHDVLADEESIAALQRRVVSLSRQNDEMWQEVERVLDRRRGVEGAA